MRPKETPQYKLQDLIDIAHFQTLQDRLNEIYSFPSAIIDNDGNILTATAWQDVCTQFYRKNSEGEKECIKSDQYIIGHLYEANPAVSYQCPHGLVDNATPIIIDGVHYGNFFTGQFFLEKPDMEFYKAQAAKYGFDEEAFLSAVRKVPVWSKEQLNSYLFFIKGLIAIISQSALKNLREIEARKQIERGEKRITALISTTKDGYWIVSADGRITEANEAYSVMTGYSREEILGMHVSDLEAEEPPAEIASRMKRIIQNGSDIFETRHRRKDGTVFDVEVSITYFPSDNPEFICFCRDITARKQAEEALQEIKNRLELATSSAHLGIWDWDIVNNNMTWDDQMFQLYGFSEKPASYGVELWQHRLHPEDSAAVWDACQAAIRGERKYDIDFRIKLPDGSVRFIKADGVVLRDAGGTGVRMIGVNHDITERKQAEMLLAAEKERLAVTLRSIGDGVITTDINGNVTIMNKVAEELTGWKQDDARGKPLSSVFAIRNEITHEPLENPVDKVLSTGQIIELANHTTLISRDGTARIIADSGAPIMDKDSNIIGVVLVFRDMTEKQRLMENAQRTDKLESIGVLAGGIAHDFNNLLGGFFGYIDLALETCDPGSKTAEYLQKAFRTFTRAKDLTQQLLTFAKGGVPIRKTGSLVPLIRECTQFALSGTNVAASFHIDTDLWLCDFDENQLGQVIDNLVINAVQAMPLGGRIDVSAVNREVHSGEIPPLKQGRYVHVSVTDTGVGIPHSILPRIFDPFFTTKNKGNGLGLAMAYSIIKKHDGEITVETEPEKGTTFHFYLPASENAAAHNGITTASYHTGSGRILIMDDEESIRETVGGMLRMMGYDVEYALHGEEALGKIDDAARSNRPYLAAILDVTIPGGMGGKETIEKIRAAGYDMVVFASSGYSEDPLMANPTAYGFTDKIIKPFRKAELTDLFIRHFKGTGTAK